MRLGNRDIDKNLPSSVSLPKCMLQPGLDQVEGRNVGVTLVLPCGWERPRSRAVSQGAR